MNKAMQGIQKKGQKHIDEVIDVELVAVNSDSCASEFQQDDREIDIENDILTRMNETFTRSPTDRQTALKSFRRTTADDLIPKEKRQKMMAEQIIADLENDGVEGSPRRQREMQIRRLTTMLRLTEN